MTEPHPALLLSSVPHPPRLRIGDELLLNSSVVQRRDSNVDPLMFPLGTSGVLSLDAVGSADGVFSNQSTDETYRSIAAATSRNMMALLAHYVPMHIVRPLAQAGDNAQVIRRKAVFAFSQANTVFVTLLATILSAALIVDHTERWRSAVICGSAVLWAVCTYGYVWVRKILSEKVFVLNVLVVQGLVYALACTSHCRALTLPATLFGQIAALSPLLTAATVAKVWKLHVVVMISFCGSVVTAGFFLFASDTLVEGDHSCNAEATVFAAILAELLLQLLFIMVLYDVTLQHWGDAANKSIPTIEQVAGYAAAMHIPMARAALAEGNDACPQHIAEAMKSLLNALESVRPFLPAIALLSEVDGETTELMEEMPPDDDFAVPALPSTVGAEYPPASSMSFASIGSDTHSLQPNRNDDITDNVLPMIMRPFVIGGEVAGREGGSALPRRPLRQPLAPMFTHEQVCLVSVVFDRQDVFRSLPLILSLVTTTSDRLGGNIELLTMTRAVVSFGRIALSPPVRGVRTSAIEFTITVSRCLSALPILKYYSVSWQMHVQSGIAWTMTAGGPLRKWSFMGGDAWEKLWWMEGLCRTRHGNGVYSCDCLLDVGTSPVVHAEPRVQMFLSAAGDSTGPLSSSTDSSSPLVSLRAECRAVDLIEMPSYFVSSQTPESPFFMRSTDKRIHNSHNHSQEPSSTTIDVTVMGRHSPSKHPEERERDLVATSSPFITRSCCLWKTVFGVDRGAAAPAVSATPLECDVVDEAKLTHVTVDKILQCLQDNALSAALNTVRSAAVANPELNWWEGTIASCYARRATTNNDVMEWYMLRHAGWLVTGISPRWILSETRAWLAETHSSSQSSSTIGVGDMGDADSALLALTTNTDCCSSNQRSPALSVHDRVSQMIAHRLNNQWIQLDSRSSAASCALFEMVITPDSGEDIATYIIDNAGRRWKRGQRTFGRGSYGYVFSASGEFGNPVAVKCMDLESRVISASAEEVSREIHTLSSLRHDNIVGYIGDALQGQYYYIFMECVPGGSLAELLSTFGKLPRHAVARYIRDALLGLKYLHQNHVVHCDIKPANILITGHGRCKLSDFGSATNITSVQENTTTSSSGGQEGEVNSFSLSPSTGGGRRSSKEEMKPIGTAAYMSPEACRGRVVFGSDLWSLGISFVELLTGSLPWPKQRLGDPYRFVVDLGKGAIPPPDLSSLKDDAEALSFASLCLRKHARHRAPVDSLLAHPFITSTVSSSKVSLAVVGDRSGGGGHSSSSSHHR